MGVQQHAIEMAGDDYDLRCSCGKYFSASSWEEVGAKFDLHQAHPDAVEVSPLTGRRSSNEPTNNLR